eukprot:CAMPEP_0114494572 /NCGR_PEP_ID=MMETSP0109-20121206/4726_1 /TAXON_ID=29199 /ORGANISM="Chlorarachnion reptans, Strain CCCM449" /LENGTH=346 /DNA_ID=CAMNT_0001671623 /DNA_START=12 /DNA_END=1052 /DNA_ORIENTATION=+
MAFLLSALVLHASGLWAVGGAYETDGAVGALGKHPWDPATDPLPPLQPKECGFQIVARADYTFTDTGEKQTLVFAAGYQLQSYQYKTVQTVSGGVNEGKAVMQTSFGNYTSPTDPRATMYAKYQTQTCDYHATEGGAPYQGYDFYRKQLQSFHQQNITVYFSRQNYSDFGPCLVYQVIAPWAAPPPAPPRRLQYSFVFEVSSGYLRLYRINGTEYCCPSGGCVDFSPTCDDGTTARQTYADSNNFYSNYHVFPNASAFEEGMLGAYCPFPGTSGPAPTSSSNNCKYSVKDMAVVSFAVGLVAFLVGVLAHGVARHCWVSMRRRRDDEDDNMNLNNQPTGQSGYSAI